MPAATPMAFGGLSNGFGRTPRHIPVHGEDMPEKHSATLTGYMIDPGYSRQAGTASVPATTMTGEHIPPLTTLDSAERLAEQDIEETEHRIFWHDWRHIIFPVATILFIIALGLTDIVFRAPSPPAPSGTTQPQPQSRATDSPISSPSANSVVGGRGGGDDSGSILQPSSLTQPNAYSIQGK